MACFIVPTAEAIVVTVAAKLVQNKENKINVKLLASDTVTETAEKVSFSRKLGWLSKLLWGGSALLAFEHVWHGEVTAWFPFLTAAGNPADAAAMLGEMGTVGVTMSVLVTLAWAAVVALTASLEKKALKPASITE